MRARDALNAKPSMQYRIMATPGVVIDEEVVHSGGVPDRKKIESWFAPLA